MKEPNSSQEDWNALRLKLLNNKKDSTGGLTYYL